MAYDERDYTSPDDIKRAAVEGLTAFEYLAGASNDPEGNATEAWLERRAAIEEGQDAGQG